ncbi:ATP-binding cassette domain-containing protein [Sneathiella sp. P13V-1]|uniref:ABCB family ABC transporter ATP-binding protein/permease n=1 Tax=Sneathiella sp. P13V-1 TaxID=2697366 RepID=UPI00187B4C94|nr:ABC transporter ATP-binding protein/permease [Sneathiella sp. P13V-1]MBE7637430.1 ATP-binding cassette domain-containing protein [Sneathiella sp. P13V-1]
MQNMSFDSHSHSDQRNHLSTAWTLMGFLWAKGRGDLKIRICIAMALLISAEIMAVLTPYILKYLVDYLSGEENTVEAWAFIPVGLVMAYGFARLFQQTFGELRDAIFAKVGQNAIRQVALQTFRHLHKLSLRFHLDRQTGGLSRVIERGTKGIDFLLRFMLFNIVPTLLKIIFICGIMWVEYGFLMSLVTAVTLVGYIYFTLAVTEWRLKYRRTMNEKDSEANTKAIDSLLNFETVKYFGNEEHESRRFDKAIAGYESAAIRSQTTLAYLNVGQGFIIALGLVAVMLISANGVANGSMTVGDFVAAHAFLMLLIQPLNFLGFVYREIKQSLVDMEKMFELISVGREIDDDPNAQPLKDGKGEIVFDKVSFGYDDKRQILHDISFTVKPGSKVAIVGPSGAGKSTISRILFRFYDVNEGSVTIDGEDIREVQQASLRQAIGIVPQDTVLFNDTIAYNVGYGRPDATDEEIKEAAQLASIDTFIEKLPDGFDTMVGERGLKLSGGEKQRVAIARTILKRPRILLFDEATSALDTRTERDIQQSLKEVSKGRTTLVIAHRLSTVVDADEILVLDKGRIVEQGTHTRLLELNGQYAEMWARQQEVADYQEKLAKVLD